MRIVTDTAGTGYNPAAATSVLVGVNSTVASVNTAIAAINNGTLAGQVPGLGLISALDNAQNAVVANQTTSLPAVDALVAKLAANVAVGTQTDIVAANANATYQQKIDAITTDSANFRIAAGTVTGGAAEPSTAVLRTKLGEAQTALDTARSALDAAGKIKAVAYENALASQAATKAPAAGEISIVKGGLQADPSAAAGLAALGVQAKAAVPATFEADGITVKTPAVPAVVAVPLTADQAYTQYLNGTAAQRATIDDALKGSAYYSSTFKPVLVKDAAAADATKAVGETKIAIDAVTNGAAFDAAVVTKTNLSTAVDKATVADVDVAAVKAITDANKVLADAVVTATTNANNFVAEGVLLHKVLGNVTNDTLSSTAVKDVFYFADKANLAATTDLTIGSSATNSFGAGDSIVLGSSLTYNNGALSTGNGNALEFFLVKTTTGVQVVIETAKYGSSEGTVTATGVTTVAGADHIATINLTGVTTDHLSVANGVISYV